MIARAVEALLIQLATATGTLPIALAPGRDGPETLLDRAAEAAIADAEAYLGRDPSLHGCLDGVLASGSSFRAVAGNRLAHQFWSAAAWDRAAAERLRGAALSVAFHARRESGADIHPGARLGEAFVLDHGYGTVIGETVETGARCYVLNGVTLGARGIADNPHGRRHPRLGDDVEIGSFACVLGPVTIGDGVFIGPHCIVCDDVPADTRIRVRHPVQVERRAVAAESPSLSATSRLPALALQGDAP